jgi:tetratricopeptide (TPR) repeat protein
MIGVFLSHSSKDKPFVRDLANALEAGGEIKVWLDEREIDYGQNIVLKIAEGLDADFVLLILSPDSVDSKWVKEEWTDAYWDQVENQSTKFAGVLYRDCRIPRLLRNKKYFDLRTNQQEGFRLVKTWLLGQRPPPPPVVHLPQRPPLFIGRETEIDELRHRLQEPGSVALVSGLAGRGKTTLALEYAHRYQRDFEAVHWLPCQGRTLVQMAGELAWQLGLKLDGELDSILRQLTGRCASKRLLLVLDNVEDDTAARLMPAGRTSVLITTRVTNLRFLRGYRPLNLPLFTEEQCFEVFREVIGKEEVGRHETEARSLFQRLGYLPIGIAVAAGLVHEDVRYTLAGLTKNLPADVYALLREAVDALPPRAQMLLAAMAVCAPEGFRLGLAAEVAELDEASSLDSLQEIYSRSLVEELGRTTRRYQLHAMMREAAGASELQRRNHAECIRKEFKDWQKDWHHCEEDLADWQAAFSWSVSKDGDRETWSMANDLAYRGYSVTARLGRLPEAHEICERMAQEANRRNDKWNLQTWYGNQALILKAWGHLDEAMTLLRKQEAICLELGSQDSLDRSYGNQALILEAWGRLDEAMALHKKADAISLELGNQNNLQVSYGNQASILVAWGHLDEAMALLRRQEAICLELGNQDSLQMSYCNQALILKAWGHLDEAMTLLREQEAICLELGSQDSLQMSYGNQALILEAWGRLDEAMALSKKQEAICLELGNQDSLQRIYGNQAVILKTCGHLDEAMALLKKQEAIGLELGSQDSLQMCYGNQAVILKTCGYLDEAMALLRKQEAICLKLGNQDSLQMSYCNQALILKAWGHLDEAKALHKQQEAICLELGSQDILAYCYWNWGLLAREQGDSRSEREKLEQAVALFTELKMPREIEAVQKSLNEANGNSNRN